MAKRTLYAIYRGDDLLVVGSSAECAKFMGWKSPRQTSIYSSRSKKRRDIGKQLNVIRITGGEDLVDIAEEIVEQPTAERGKLLNVFGVIGEDGLHHKAAFVLSRGRSHKDLLTVLEQERKSKKARLSSYGQSLYESCFRNW